MNRHEKALAILKNGTVIPATPLALDGNRGFDEKRQRLIIRYYLTAGVGGIATAVHSTQFEIRNPDINLFETVLKIVSDEIQKFENDTGKVIVKISGVCGKTLQAISEAKLARSLGFDAVLLSPCGLNDLSENEMIERTKAVSEIIPVIGFYLQTACGGRMFTYEYWERICEIKSVVAIKCASFNRYTTIDVVRSAALSKRSNEITLYTGNDDNIVADLITDYSFCINGKCYKKRFEGGLLGHWTIWTKKVVDMFPRLKHAKATPELMHLASEITDVNCAVFDARNNFAGCIPGIHEILRRQGLLLGNWCLDPNEKLSDGQMKEIDRVYKMYPHLNDDQFVKEFLKNEKV